MDSTLDEMRSASNETSLSRLLTSAYEQLDAIKVRYRKAFDRSIDFLFDHLAMHVSMKWNTLSSINIPT